MKNPTLKPPLKWVGGKQRILPALLPFIPREGRLIEPFVGAGAVFLNAGERPLVINDVNKDLVSMYKMLRDVPLDYIERARPLFTSDMHSPEAYADARRRFNSSSDNAERAALLLYLNKFGFNGLHRVNSKGHFNVPYGHPKTLPRFPLEQLQAMARRLQEATIMCGDFRPIMALAKAGDVLYCDPPYANGDEDKATFVGYTPGRFSNADQADLAALAWDAAARGATVVISNHDTPRTRALYAEMQVHTVEARRSVAADACHRGKARELIAILRPDGS